MKLDTPYTLKDISLLINADFKGDPGLLISGLNEIHMVEPGDLTFVDHPKYYDRALNSKATTIIINKKIEHPNNKALIISNDPLKDYNSLVKKFKPFEKCDAPVSSTAQIGEGTILQPGVFIGNHVKIGNNCLIHSNVSIYDHCIIGDNVIIHANTVLGADPYYFQRRKNTFLKLEPCGRVIIEDNVEIGALCSIDKGVSGDTIIGKETKMDNHCQVGHDTYIGKNCLIGSHAAIAGVTRIEDDVILWGRVAINKDIVIAKGTIILATSAINKSTEKGKTYFGVPAREARKMWKEIAAIRRLPEIIENFYPIENSRKFF